jgi:hypothetical protein
MAKTLEALLPQDPRGSWSTLEDPARQYYTNPLGGAIDGGDLVNRSVEGVYPSGISSKSGATALSLKSTALR